MSTTEDIYAAIWALVASVPGFAFSSRTLETWDALSPSAEMPALMMITGKEEARVVRGLPTVMDLHPELYVYAATDKSSGISAATILSGLVDAVTVALAPDASSGEQTLGGLCSHCRIEGQIQKDEGVLGDIAMAIIPLKIVAVLTLPAASQSDPIATMSIVPPGVVTNIPLRLQLVMADALGHAIDPSMRNVQWGVEDDSIAQVSQNGVVTQVSAGSTTVIAMCEGKVALATVTVQALVYSVSVSPTSFSLLKNGTQQLTVVARDVLGNILTGRTTTFTPANSGIATCNTTGLVTAHGDLGSTTILVDVEGEQATAQCLIRPSVAQVIVTPTPVSVGVGNTQQLTVVLKDAGGNILTGRSIVFASSDVTKATVDPATGLVTGVALGSVNITATSEGIVGTSATTVIGNGPYGIVSLPAAWWKRDTLAALANGATVSTWLDSGPSGYTLTKEAGVLTWDKTFLGGSVEFGASTPAKLLNAVFNELANAPHATAFVVGRWDGLPDSNRSMFGTNGFGLSVGYQSGTTLFHWFGGGGINNRVGHPFNDLLPHVFEVVYDGTQASNAGRVIVLVDGVPQTLTFSGTIPATLGALGAGVAVGGTYGDATTAIAAHIAEVLPLKVTLSSADRSAIRVALGAKYGITVTP